MNSRQRILESLNHRQPDRVPIDLGGHRSSTFSVQAYKNFREYLGLENSRLYIFDMLQQLALPEEDVLEILHIDTINDAHIYLHRPEMWQDWELQDGTECKIPAYLDVRRNDSGDWIIYNQENVPVAIQKRNCLYFEQLQFPYKVKTDDCFSDLAEQSQKMMWSAVQPPPYPADFDESGVNLRKTNSAALRKSTDKAIYCIFGGSLLEYLNQAFGMDNSLCNLLLEPRMVNSFLDTAVETYMENFEKFAQAHGDTIDIIGWSDDLGGQNNTLISTDVFRKYFVPRYKHMWNFAKKRMPDAKLCLHSCGAISPFIRDIIDCGMDAINPVQISSRGMELANLKREFGQDLTFWGGGCDTMEILPEGTPAQIKDHVRKNLEIMMPGGGYVFQQVHNIMANVPPQNVMAMFEAVHAFQ